MAQQEQQHTVTSRGVIVRIETTAGTKTRNRSDKSLNQTDKIKNKGLKEKFN